VVHEAMLEQTLPEIETAEHNDSGATNEVRVESPLVDETPIKNITRILFSWVYAVIGVLLAFCCGVIVYFTRRSK